MIELDHCTNWMVSPICFTSATKDTEYSNKCDANHFLKYFTHIEFQTSQFCCKFVHNSENQSVMELWNFGIINAGKYYIFENCVVQKWMELRNNIVSNLWHRNSWLCRCGQHVTKNLNRLSMWTPTYCSLYNTTEQT